MTDEERQELETLRAEKTLREQTERASTALTAAGVPQSFAQLLIGQTDEETDRKIQAFCATYQESLAQDVKSRLPKQAPVITAPPPQRPRRGIHRLH